MRRSARALAHWLTGTGLGLVVGCTHQDPADRSLDKLRADIAKIASERDRLEQRVEALEASERRRNEEAVQFMPRKPQPPSEPARQLPVVRVAQEDAQGAGRPPRQGDAPAASSDAKRDYEAALALARSNQHEKALQGFTAFLVRFPDHPSTENAMYWRGECFYATGAFARAAEQFEGLVARFPYGNKAADGLLKLGLAQEKAGMKEKAQKTFAELRDRYPKSDAARQVPNT